MSTQPDANLDEQTRKALVSGWEVIKASDGISPEGFKNKYEEIIGDSDMSVTNYSQVLHTLENLGMIELENGFGYELKPVETDFGTEELLAISGDELPTKEEFQQDLVHVGSASSQQTYDFYEIEGEGNTVELPLMPVAYVEEHFSRYELDTKTETTSSSESVRAEDSMGWGSIQTVLTTENDYQNNETTIEVQGEFYLPEIAASLHNSKGGQKYVDVIRNRRLETLREDVERVYELAEEAANKGVERDGEYKDLEDVTEKLNNRLNTDYDVEEAINWCHKNATSYFNQDKGMGSVPLVGPIAGIMEEGRDNGRDLASYENKFSDNELKNRRTDKGEEIIDLYFNSMKKII